MCLLYIITERLTTNPQRKSERSMHVENHVKSLSAAFSIKKNGLDKILRESGCISRKFYCIILVYSRLPATF